MKNKTHEATMLGAFGAAIGKGLIAGLAGTIAMTISQKIEMKITRRKPSTATADAVKKAMHITPDKATKEAHSEGVQYT